MKREKHKCPPHHFIINSDDVGYCKYCPEVREFRKLLRKAERAVVGSGPASLVNPNRWRPRKKKEEIL